MIVYYIRVWCIPGSLVSQLVWKPALEGDTWASCAARNTRPPGYLDAPGPLWSEHKSSASLGELTSRASA